MRVPGSFNMFTVDPVDGGISQMVGGLLRSTGIRATAVTLPIPGAAQVEPAICIEHRQIDQAIRDWKAAFPQSQISIVEHSAVEAGLVKLTGGGPAYADEWIVVNGKVAVNPLALRLLAVLKRNIRETFEGELQDAGLLADVS